MNILKLALALFAILYLVPLGVSAVRYRLEGGANDWRTADRSSTGLLPPAAQSRPASVRIFSARTVSWRGVFASHSWLVFKPEGAGDYTRYDYTAWGAPVRLNGFPPDGRWFGAMPEVVFAAEGPAAAALIPRLQKAVQDYAWRRDGDYQAWPGPNSNTFIAAVMDAVPEISVALPPTAIGKDYPYDGRWLRIAPGGAGVQLRLGGYAGLAIGWVDGIEVDILGAVAGLDIRHPAIKLPGLGRFGLPVPSPLPTPATPV